jgi:signal transduction histidine kinase
MISADRNEVIQLIGSLLANAREALPLGGSITIETSNVEVDSPASGDPAELHSGIYVRMLFSTDGCAVQPERRNASIRMIVDRMGGFLVTTNDSKLGNIHKIYLPRVEAAAGQASLLANTIGA